MESVTSRIFSDAELAKVPPITLKTFVDKLVESKGRDMGVFYQCRYLRFDFKYIAKPDLMP